MVKTSLYCGLLQTSPAPTSSVAGGCGVSAEPPAPPVPLVVVVLDDEVVVVVDPLVTDVVPVCPPPPPVPVSLVVEVWGLVSPPPPHAAATVASAAAPAHVQSLVLAFNPASARRNARRSRRLPTALGQAQLKSGK
jgi:hypothetical protein